MRERGVECKRENVFPIRSNVKLCSLLVAILDREQNNIFRELYDMLWEQNNRFWEQDIIVREQCNFFSRMATIYIC